jgi:hypothetical protein
MTNNKNQIVFVAYNHEHIEIFKGTQSFKQLFTIFNNPIEEINIENEEESIELVKNTIEEYINEYIKENGETEYKCFIQF